VLEHHGLNSRAIAEAIRLALSRAAKPVAVSV
jgi:hypothetical protein